MSCCSSHNRPSHGNKQPCGILPSAGASGFSEPAAPFTTHCLRTRFRTWVPIGRRSTRPLACRRTRLTLKHKTIGSVACVRLWIVGTQAVCPAERVFRAMQNRGSRKSLSRKAGRFVLVPRRRRYSSVAPQRDARHHGACGTTRLHAITTAPSRITDESPTRRLRRSADYVTRAVGSFS